MKGHHRALSSTLRSPVARTADEFCGGELFEEIINRSGGNPISSHEPFRRGRAEVPTDRLCGNVGKRDTNARGGVTFSGASILAPASNSAARSFLRDTAFLKHAPLKIVTSVLSEFTVLYSKCRERGRNLMVPRALLEEPKVRAPFWWCFLQGRLTLGLCWGFLPGGFYGPFSNPSYAHRARRLSGCAPRGSNWVTCATRSEITCSKPRMYVL